MAVVNVYAVRDVRTEAYMKPFFLQNDMVLERSLSDAMQDGNSLFCTHPEDYQVFRLGTFDDNAGKFELFDGPQHMFNLVDKKVGA